MEPVRERGDGGGEGAGGGSFLRVIDGGKSVFRISNLEDVSRTGAAAAAAATRGADELVGWGMN